MGMNTKGFIASKYKTEDINEILKSKFGVETTIEDAYFPDNKIIVFTYNDEQRRMSVFENYKDHEHTGVEECLLIDLNYWGSSVELIRGILEEFGGQMVDNDCSDDWKPVDKTSA